jgi:tRNA nucleotidyltransferase (CCA-adding enzyme)
MPDERSAGAVVFRVEDDRPLYLLLKYRSGHWGFVKGHIEEGESIRETVRREAIEETGIEHLEFAENFEDAVTYHFQRSGSTVHKRVDFLLAYTTTEEVELGSPQEHVDMAWLGYDEAQDRLRFDDMQQLLRDANEHVEATHPRLHRS